MDEDDIYKFDEEIKPRERESFFNFDNPESRKYTEIEEIRFEYNKMKVAKILQKIQNCNNFPSEIKSDQCFKLIPYIIYTPRVTLQFTTSIYSILEDLIKERKNEIDIVKAFYQIFNYLYCLEEDDYFRAIQYFTHCSLWETLDDLLLDAIHKEDNEIINFTLSVFAIGIERFDQNNQIKLFKRMMETQIIQHVKIICDNKINDTDGYVLSFIEFLFKTPLGEYQITVRDYLYPIVLEYLFRDDCIEENIILSYQIFTEANETGDLYYFCCENQEILNKLCTDIQSRVPKIAVVALKFLKSLISNGEEMLDLLEKFLDLNVLISLLSSDDLKISMNAIDVIFTIFQQDAIDCKSALVDILCQLDFNGLFSEKSFEFKSKLVSQLYSILCNFDMDHIHQITNESFLQFLAYYMDIDRIYEVFDVANILLLILERTQYDIRITDQIRNVFIDNSFDLMEEIANDVDPDDKDESVMKDKINEFLSHFRIANE